MNVVKTEDEQACKQESFRPRHRRRYASIYVDFPNPEKWTWVTLS